MTMTAEAVASQGTCDNKIVTVLERGRIDSVTRSLLIKVGILKFNNGKYTHC